MYVVSCGIDKLKTTVIDQQPMNTPIDRPFKTDQESVRNVYQCDILDISA